MSFEDFFTQAEDQTSPIKDRLPNILNPITPLQSSLWSTHGVSAIPQACLAHATQFNVIELDKSIASYHSNDESLRGVTPKSTRHNSGPKPALLQEKRAILLHEKTYQTPISITPTRIAPTIHKNLTDPLSYIPTATSKAFLDVLKTEIPNTKIPALFAAAKTTLSHHPSSTALIDALDQLDLQAILFPTIISMLNSPEPTSRKHRTRHKHYCSEIRIENTIDHNQVPFVGLMHFFRDAFFDLSSCSSQTTFFIETLIGFNDFSIFFDLQSLLYKSTLPPFALALNHHINKNITLSKVYVTTQGYLGKNYDEIAVTIIFILDECAWELCFHGKITDFPQETAWHCKLIFDGSRYSDRYEQAKKKLTTSTALLEIGFAHLQVSSV